MAEYPDRIEELSQSILNKYSDLRGQAGSAEQLLSLSLMSGVEKYGEWRDKALAGALDRLMSGSGARGQGQQDAWADYLRKMSEDSAKVLGECLKFDADDPANMVWEYFRSSTVQSESRFFMVLSSLKLGRLAGSLVEYRETLDDENYKNLGDRWKKFREDARSADDYGPRKSLVEYTGRMADEQLGKIHDVVLLKEVSRAAGESVGVALLAHAISPAILVEYVHTVVEAKKKISEAVQSYKAAQRDIGSLGKDTLQRLYAKGTICYMFRGAREMVGSFLEKYDVEQIKNEYERLFQDCRSVAGSAFSTGQARDANRFLDKAAVIVKPYLEKAGESYIKFIDDHRSVFTGPVGDDTLEDLLRGHDKEQLFDAAMRVEEKLRTMVDNSKIAFFEYPGEELARMKALKDKLDDPGMDAETREKYKKEIAEMKAVIEQARYELESYINTDLKEYYEYLRKDLEIFHDSMRKLKDGDAMNENTVKG